MTALEAALHAWSTWSPYHVVMQPPKCDAASCVVRADASRYSLVKEDIDLHLLLTARR